MIVHAPHSADVQLNLFIHNQMIPLSKIGRDEIFIRDPITISRGIGEVILTIDGREHRWAVELLHGAVPFDEAVATRQINQ